MVHPFHGPVRVVGDTVRMVRKTPTRYLEFESIDGPLKISVPLEKVDELGLRPVLDDAGVQRILDLLRAPSEQGESTWSRRIKDYQLRIQSGELEQRLTVLRDIVRTKGASPVPGAERDLLREVRDGLVAEISIARDVSREDAEALINDAALGSDAGMASLEVREEALAS